MGAGYPTRRSPSVMDNEVSREVSYPRFVEVHTALGCRYNYRVLCFHDVRGYVGCNAPWRVSQSSLNFQIKDAGLPLLKLLPQ